MGTSATTTENFFSIKMALERTFIMVKPDGVSRGLISEVISRFEKRAYKLVAMKFTQGGPVVAMVWEGKNAVKQGRAMMGETDPSKSAPGTIRGDYCIDTARNLVHGSDSLESAKKEIALWFPNDEGFQNWKLPAHDQVYE